MAIIKCKMCGGDIEISPDKTFGTCEYCGSTMTLPKVDDEQRAAAFNRGNHFRRSGEFDKALAVYERIVAEDDNDAEAHWCCALCRFGIEYVEDPATYEWLPTCHRASFDSFLEDVDYLAAVEHSDGITRRQYQKDAAKIAEVQRGILATSQNEQPFDVFLCYKETGEDGQRTRDSLMAQEVYYELTEQGYRVFFARITLEDKAGAEYEPYIFAALNSAKVMIVIGTKPEHFNAVWVKNEWSRFLSMMKKDRSKLLLPCYRDMDPYDLPEALSVLQSYDMGKIGFMQDLIRGVKKVIDAGKPQETAKETVKETVVVHNEGGSNVQALLDRGQMALEDGEWAKADEFFEQVLNQDAKCGAAYLGKFLASKNSKNAQDFVQSYLSTIKANIPTAKSDAACTEDADFVKKCIDKYSVNPYFTEKDIRKLLTYDRFYCANAASFLHRAVETATELLAKDRNFARAEKYATGEAKERCANIRGGLIDSLYSMENERRQYEKDEQNRITNAYHSFLHDAEEEIITKYKENLAAKAKYDKEQERHRIEREQREREEMLRKKRQNKIIAISTAVIITVVALALVITKVIIPNTTYKNAVTMFNAQNYDGAISAFSTLNGYKDSDDYLHQSKYQKAVMLMDNGDFDNAISAFADLSDYADAASLQQEATYKKASMLFESEKWEEAISTYSTLGKYADAQQRVLECYYKQGESYREKGDFVKAASCFEHAEDFSDAHERIVDVIGELFVNKIALSAGVNHTVALMGDGSVIATGRNFFGECDVSDWTNVVSVLAGPHYTAALCKDGKVLITDYKENEQFKAVENWPAVIQIAAGYNHVAGLKADGTVVVVGRNNDGQQDVTEWKDIRAISAGYFHTVGLKADGTVVATGDNDEGQCDVEDWSNIIAVSAGQFHTVGLKADGTVVATGKTSSGQCDVESWTDIVDIAVGKDYTVGLKSDGTVIATGRNYNGSCDVSSWRNIVAICVGENHTVGLKSDGTVVATGDNDNGQCNVSGWKNIKLPD